MIQKIDVDNMSAVSAMFLMGTALNKVIESVNSIQTWKPFQDTRLSDIAIELRNLRARADQVNKKEAEAVVKIGSLPSGTVLIELTKGTFTWAMSELRQGKTVTRRGWNSAASRRGVKIAGDEFAIIKQTFGIEKVTYVDSMEVIPADLTSVDWYEY